MRVRFRNRNIPLLNRVRTISGCPGIDAKNQLTISRSLALLAHLKQKNPFVRISSCSQSDKGFKQNVVASAQTPPNLASSIKRIKSDLPAQPKSTVSFSNKAPKSTPSAASAAAKSKNCTSWSGLKCCHVVRLRCTTSGAPSRPECQNIQMILGKGRFPQGAGWGKALIKSVKGRV